MRAIGLLLLKPRWHTGKARCAEASRTVSTHLQSRVETRRPRSVNTSWLEWTRVDPCFMRVWCEQKRVGGELDAHWPALDVGVSTVSFSQFQWWHFVNFFSKGSQLLTLGYSQGAFVPAQDIGYLLKSYTHNYTLYSLYLLNFMQINSSAILMRTNG